jgi:hypothetical protein
VARWSHGRVEPAGVDDIRGKPKALEEKYPRIQSGLLTETLRMRPPMEQSIAQPTVAELTLRLRPDPMQSLQPILPPIETAAVTNAQAGTPTRRPDVPTRRRTLRSRGIRP